jgi:hypothetical protein
MAMFDYNPQPTRKEYREIKKDFPEITWEDYLKQKERERRNWNPKAEAASHDLFKIAGDYTLYLELCHKTVNTTDKRLPRYWGEHHMRYRIEGDRGVFWLCSWCGYLCKVDGNRYIYDPILKLGINLHPDTKFDVDSHYNVVTVEKVDPAGML